MKNQPRAITLGDHLLMIRRRRVLIVLVALLCAGAVLAVSLLQKPSYDARASLSVRDPNEALSLVGGSAVSNQTPLEVASGHVQQVTRPSVAEAVKKDLHSPLTPAQLVQKVDVSVDPNSTLVDVTAHDRSGSTAADIANGFAKEDVKQTTSATRKQFAQQAKALKKKLSGGGGNGANKVIYLEQLSRLQTLSSVALPVTVNASARTPSTPTSPRPVRNTLAALALGLLLGIVAAYARDALDQRLRQPSDVEDLIDHPIVGYVPTEALGHAGVGDKRNGLKPMSEADEESFRILRQNVRYLAAEDPLRTLLVTSASAQEGKSTVAACLAAAAAGTGKRTLLVECDLRRPVLAARLGVAEKPGLTDYLTGNAEPNQILQAVPALAATTNGGQPRNGDAETASDRRLVCITAGTLAPRPADLLASDRFEAFLAEVSEVYETVILDTAPLLTVADTLEIVPHVAGVLVCVRLRQTRRDQLRSTQAALDRLPVPPVGVVLTDVREAAEGYYGYYGAPTAAGKA